MFELVKLETGLWTIQSNGHIVCSAHTAKEALEKLKNNAIYFCDNWLATLYEDEQLSKANSK